MRFIIVFFFHGFVIETTCPWKLKLGYCVKREYVSDLWEKGVWGAK